MKKQEALLRIDYISIYFRISFEHLTLQNYFSNCSIQSRFPHIGNAKNPCTKASIGDTTTVAGTDITEEEAIVIAITARAVTGHSSETGHLFFMIVTVRVAATAAITDMVGLVVIRLTENMQRMVFVTSRPIPIVELACSVIITIV